MRLRARPIRLRGSCFCSPLRVTKWGHLKRVSSLPFPLLFLSFPFSFPCAVYVFFLLTIVAALPLRGRRRFSAVPFFLSLFFPFPPLSFSFHSPFSFLFLLSAFPFSPLAALFHVLLNCSARRIRFQVINNMWATAPRNLYFVGHKPPKYRKFRQSYQHFIVEILIFVEKCVTIDV